MVGRNDCYSGTSRFGHPLTKQTLKSLEKPQPTLESPTPTKSTPEHGVIVAVGVLEIQGDPANVLESGGNPVGFVIGKSAQEVYPKEHFSK